ncbi:MAG: nuclear transport factor 2 family protein [Dokdonella sp.]
MHKLLIALTVSLLASGQSVASEKDDVMLPVHQLFASFNDGDATTAVAGCADVTSIIDDFPPHEWHGAEACPKWMSAYKAYAKANEITDMVITLSEPRHVDISSDLAYVVVPANYTLKKQGKLASSANSIVTLALKKGANGWRITSWAWADP